MMAIVMIMKYNNKQEQKGKGEMNPGQVIQKRNASKTSKKIYLKS